MLHYSYKANSIFGNKALILVTKLSRSVTGWGTLLLDVCWLVTGQHVSHTILCWTDVKRVLSCDRTWDSTDTLKWYIVLLVQTKVVLYCSAMGYARYSISCQCMTIVGCICYYYGSLRSWTWVCRRLKSLGTAKTLINIQYSTLLSVWWTPQLCEMAINNKCS